MIKCPSCGEMIEDHAKFCINCGTPIKATAAQPPQQEPEESGSVFGRKPYHNSRADFVPESQKDKKSFLDYSERRMAYEKQNEEVIEANPNYTPNAMMQNLSSKLRGGGIVLVIAGIFQALYGIAAVLAAAAMAMILRSGTQLGSPVAMIAIAVGIAIFGAIAMISSITDLTTAGKNFRCAKKALINPKGMTEYLRSGKTTSMLVLNIVSVGVVGIVGTVMTNSARSYAQENMREIEKIEAKY